MRTRLRAEAGIGLVELLIALTVLAVALLALVAALSSGALALRRAGHTSTAAAIANQQMELYRGLKYCSIRLDDGSLPTTAPYVGDPADGSPRVLDTATCGGSTPTCPAGTPNSFPADDPDAIFECDASRDLSGPDSREYRVDTYIVRETPSGARELKKVTVVVRDGDNLSGQPLVRTSSKFDQISG